MDTNNVFLSKLERMEKILQEVKQAWLKLMATNIDLPADTMIDDATEVERNLETLYVQIITAKRARELQLSDEITYL